MTHPWNSALVTGASSGIGEAMVRRLAATGIDIVVVARRVDRLEALAAELPGIEVLAADLTDLEDLARVESRLGDRERPIDLCVNNAGFGTSGRFVDLDGDRLGREVDLNCRAVVRLCSAALGPMAERGRGWVINVSSVASFQPTPTLAAYAATKAYVTSLTESLVEEMRGTGVYLTALCPGLTHTEFQQVSSDGSIHTRAPEMMWLDADVVARAGLAAAAKGRALCVPGGVYKAMAAAVAVAPRTVVRRAAGLISRFSRSAT
jgi:short-subunit dehydrogenase